jgi:hypothetical protein
MRAASTLSRLNRLAIGAALPLDPHAPTELHPYINACQPKPVDQARDDLIGTHQRLQRLAREPAEPFVAGTMGIDTSAAWVRRFPPTK